MENKFYVYGHFDASGMCRYIGKGQKNRAWAFDQRNWLWKETFKDEKPEVRILAKGLSEDESFEVEIEKIKEALAAGSNLLNIAAGGYGGDTRNWDDRARALLSQRRKGSGSHWYGKERDQDTKEKLRQSRLGVPGYWLGKTRDPELIEKMTTASRTPEAKEKRAAALRGRKHTEEHNAKISAAIKGENHPNFGKKYSDELRQKLSDSHKGIKYGPMSEEHKAKISEARKNSDAVKASASKVWETRRANGTADGHTTGRAKAVVCVETGAVYRCAKDAAQAVGGNDKHIQACCVGRRARHKGLSWEYTKLGVNF